MSHPISPLGWKRHHSAPSSTLLPAPQKQDPDRVYHAARHKMSRAESPIQLDEGDSIQQRKREETLRRTLQSSSSQSTFQNRSLQQWFPLPLRDYHVTPLTPSPSTEQDTPPRIWESEYVTANNMVEHPPDRHSSDEESHSISVNDSEYPEDRWSHIKTRAHSSPDTDTLSTDGAETTDRDDYSERSVSSHHRVHLAEMREDPGHSDHCLHCPPRRQAEVRREHHERQTLPASYPSERPHPLLKRARSTDAHSTDYGIPQDDSSTFDRSSARCSFRTAPLRATYRSRFSPVRSSYQDEPRSRYQDGLSSSVKGIVDPFGSISLADSRPGSSHYKPRLPPIIALEDYPPLKKSRPSNSSASMSSVGDLRRSEQFSRGGGSSYYHDRDILHNPRHLSPSPIENYMSQPLPSPSESQTEGSVTPLMTVRSKDEWKKHTVSMQGADDVTVFKCVWQGLGQRPCGYTAKRHLVKRHIETRHLQIKDHICSYCGKAFPQRTSLAIHLNRHTGEKPHECHFKCGKYFSDPARRHKHMVEVHGYSPQGPRKRYTNSNYDAPVTHASILDPWSPPVPSNGSK